MNKTLKQLMVLTLACVTLCGTTMAAPRGGKGRPPKPAPRHQTTKRPPAPRHHGHHKVHHHNRHGAGWVTLGAAVVGGLVGGLLGGCR